MTKDAKLKLKAWKKYKTECDVKVTGDLRDGFWAGWHYCRQARDAEIEQLKQQIKELVKTRAKYVKEVTRKDERIKELEGIVIKTASPATGKGGHHETP